MVNKILPHPEVKLVLLYYWLLILKYIPSSFSATQRPHLKFRCNKVDCSYSEASIAWSM